MKKTKLLLVMAILTSISCNALNYYWVGGSGSWSDLSHWSLSPGGGVFHSQVPQSTDNVFFDVNSFTASGQTVTVDQTIVQCADMNWTGVTNTPIFSGDYSNTLRIYGSLTLATGMINNFNGQISMEATIGGQTITTAGQILNNTLIFNGIGGEWILQDALTLSDYSSLFFYNGTLNTNNQTVTVFSFEAYSSSTLTLGSSTLNFSNLWYIHPASTVTINAGTSTIRGADIIGYSPRFLGGGLAYHDVFFNGSGQIHDNNTFHTVTFSKNGTIFGSNTYDNLNFLPGYTYILPAGLTQTITTSLNVNGNCGALIGIVKSSTLDVQANISKASGNVTVSYVTLKDINATGGATFTANNSLDLGNNTGWTINNLPSKNLYWVGNAGNWGDGNHWSTISGGAPSGCSPTPVDNVFFDANSFSLAGQTVTINVPTAYCNNMNWSGVGNSPTLYGDYSGILKIYGSFMLATAMNFNYIGPISFEATTGGKTITTAGNVINTSLTFNGIGGEWTLQDALTLNNNGYIYLNNGTLNSNNQTVTANSFASYTSSARTLIMGSSTFNLSGDYTWSIQNSSGMALNAGTSTINSTTNGILSHFGSDGLTYHDVFFASGATLSGNNTFHDLTISKNGTINGSNTFDNLIFSPGYTYILPAGLTQTINTSLNVNGNCGALIGLIKSSDIGSQATISKASGTVTVSYATLKDINATGGATFIANNAIDLGNNTGWTINAMPSKNLYWVGNGGNWGDGSHWSASSGGAPSGCSPTAVDNVFFDANSFSLSGQTVTVNVPNFYFNNMNWTGVTNTPTLYGDYSSTMKLYGSLTLAPGMNYNYIGPVNFEATTTGQTISTAGKVINAPFRFNGIGGGWTLQDDLTLINNRIELNNGSLNTNNQTVKSSDFESSTSFPRTLTMGSSTFNFSGYWVTQGAGMTLNAGTSTIVGADPNGNESNFYGGGLTYNDAFFAGDAKISQSNIFHTVTIEKNGTINDNNTFDNLVFSPGYTYTLPAGQTQTVGNICAQGNGALPIRIQSSVAGNPATISKANGTICWDYVRVSDISATGGATFNAGLAPTNSQDMGGNTGLLFTGACTPVSCPCTSPSITSQPVNKSVCAGNMAIFEINAFGSGLTYQWQVDQGAGFTNLNNNAHYSGVTSKTLNLTSVTTTMSGYQYRCIITGTCAPISTSTAAMLTVNQSPIITVNSATICSGQTATLTASGAASYFWLGGGGSNTNSITVSPTVTTSYMVMGMTGSCTGMAFATVTVNPLPTVSVNSATINSGQTATLTASGATNYVWSIGGMMGDTTNPISVSPTTTTSYNVTGTTNGCSNTVVATVTVNSSATANAGPDQSVCSSNASVSLYGSIGIATGGVWSTSGSGTFSPNTNTLNAIYTPSAADITAGTVTLTLTTTGNGNNAAVSDTMIVSFTLPSHFGLLASGTITSNDSAFVVGDIGAINGISYYIRASGNVLQNNNVQIQQALSNIITDKNCFASLTGTNIPAQLNEQSLFAGNYLIQGNSTLNSAMNLSGDTSSIFIFNIQGDLTVLNGSLLALNNLKYKNIIWNVSGNVTLQGNIDFSGIIISNGNILYNTENFGKVSLSAPNGNITLQNSKLVIPLSLYSPDDLKNLFTLPITQLSNPDPSKIPFCDSKTEPSLSKKISLPIDRFNKAWISSGNPPTTASNCSGFNLYFEDVILGTGVGFDAPSGIGTIRQQTACAVFNYLATVINLNGVQPDILIAASETNGIGPLAVGSPFFASIVPAGFDGGDLYKHITTGMDPASFPYDGRIKINFGNKIINGNVITVFSGYPASSSGQIDLFSVMLHEAMHALGFASFIGYPNGASALNGTYSIFDKYIKKGNNFLISPSATFQGNAPLDLISNQLFFSKTNSCAPQPVFSIDPFQIGSSLSHYDDTRSTYNFVMRPSTSGGDDRILTNPEIRTLCDLGYSVFGTFCTNCAPQGITDFGSASCGGNQICINAISNDTDSESNPITFDLTFGNNGILILNGGGSTSISGNQVCYTPPATFTGTARLQYRPKDALSSGNVTDIYITISCPYCPTDPCNLVCNGNMEEGIPLTAFEAYSNFLDFANTYPLPTNVTNWWGTNPSPDLFIRGSQRPGPYTPNQGIPLNFFNNNNYSPNGVDTHNGFPNDRYVGGYRTASSSPFYEGLFTELVQPLNQTKTYNLDLWVFAANQTGAGGITGMVNVLLSNTVPSSSGNNIIAGPGTQSIISNYTFQNSLWHHIIIPNITPAFANLKYLIIEPVKPTSGNWSQYLFFDDVRLVESAPPITITKNVNNPTPSYNQNITYAITACNTGNTTANNVVIQDILPPGLTVVSGYTSYPNITIGNLAVTQCTTVNVVATVTNSIPVNTNITNCAVILSGGSNCMNNTSGTNCVDIKVPATDISVVKTVSNQTPCSGSGFSYSIVVSNLGNENASNIHVQDLLPSGINYVSYTLSCSGTYNTSTGDIYIPALAANASCTLNIVVNTPAGTSGAFNNCATLLSLDQIDLGLGNNSSCAGINVSLFSVNFTTGLNLCISTSSNPNPISFTYTGSAATNYSWYFGDNTQFSNLQNPTHSYTSPGIYQVTLTVAASTGCNYTYSKQINISPSCCVITYNDIPNNITTSTTWSTNLKINKTITVNAPALLTIAQNIVIQFGPFGRIILENGTGIGANGSGAELDLKPGSKLTSTDCPVMWQGVEVWGKSANNSFVTLGQARITMRPGSTIENAHIGVLLGKSKICIPDPPPPCYNPPNCVGSVLCAPYTPFDIAYGGGIIEAEQANFNKNGTAVEFISYSKNNSSKIRNCSFTGGVLKDNGYKTGNVYTYPNSVNPYYAPAINSLGTAPRLSYLWKVKNVSFTDNTFKTADKGIQLYDAKCIIVKGLAQFGNQFINLNQGISGMYSSTSPFMGNTIKQNTFKNILPPVAGASPVVACIYLSGSQTDRIESNTFGDQFFAYSQANNPFGIYLNNSSYFKVLDNKFYKNKTGIYVNKSFNNGGIIQRYTDPQSNFFQRCSTSVQTNLDNSKLKIRCNITNNSVATDYGINWYNNAGKLANQGLPASSSQIRRPAGNRFNSFNTSTACGGSSHRREIKNDFAAVIILPWPLTGTISIPVPYTYYSHSGPVEYIPCNSGGVAVSQTSASCPGFAQCCPTDPCLGPNPPASCYPHSPENSTDITSLKMEFNNVSATLDKGQTALLIAAINQNTADGQLKTMLLNNSLLSDVTLNSFINRTQATSPGTFKDVIIPNSPVSDSVLPSLHIKLQTLPQGIAKQIKDAQSSNAYRTLTTINREIEAFGTELQSAVNNVLSFYVDNDSAQAIALLKQQNTTDADQSLLGTYIVNGNFSTAQVKRDSMTASNAEDQAYIDLQSLILNLEQQGKNVFEMDNLQEQLVRTIAAMPSSLAQVNACAILSLVFNETCAPSVPRKLNTEIVPNNIPLNSQSAYLGDNIPNPFNNLSVIPYVLPENTEKANINIYDLTGKLIKGYEVHSSSNSLLISSQDFSDGFYIYKLETNGEILGSKKMVITK